MKKSTIDLKKQAIEAIREKLIGKQITYNQAYAIMYSFSHNLLGEIFVAYFAAASFKGGFNDDELYFLTKAMVETGNKLSLKGIVADKHSIGGLPGARSTLIIVPIIAAAGYLIPKTSSRAITTPAGTADCMEVLAPVEFKVSQVERIVHKTGGCIIWNGMLGLAPADDIIIRVEKPLAFESFDKVIMSILAKKIAASSQLMVLDIPVGPTMKIRHATDAVAFKDKFTRIASRFGLQVEADINYQREPAGFGIGPVHELKDALAVLEQKSTRSHDLEYKSVTLATKLLKMCFKVDKRTQDAESLVRSILNSGKALEKFREITQAQGGSGDFSSDTLPKPRYSFEIKSTQSGKVTSVNNYYITAIAKVLGAPNEKIAGMTLVKRFSDKVAKNETLYIMHTNKQAALKEARETARYMPIYTIK
ncbi:thymidine phosphorylase [Candidatus Roizmanbacteria bacterium CG10_big_fil_rev_8_21_14_0_10_39_6]|uniref:Thymidine phosphorylase n=1 Tax=Candidatus Roizmanbacteria bacterium CG10_big_fil_rev_8_21_14_0_10_39_6 TaxID=1974853 RepID=A0A2M8KRD7_9BACT|nr:MAG: thymidine phosphorylase [Candidatus Roizmanbacteria bacterium CG10_big_fil_rev_8_21_14_0_10_39_6]